MKSSSPSLRALSSLEEKAVAVKTRSMIDWASIGGTSPRGSSMALTFATPWRTSRPRVWIQLRDCVRASVRVVHGNYPDINA